MYIVKNGNFYTVHSDYGDALITYFAILLITWAFNLTLGLTILAVKLSFLLCAAILKGVWKLGQVTVHLVLKPAEQEQLYLQGTAQHREEVGEEPRTDAPWPIGPALRD